MTEAVTPVDGASIAERVAGVRERIVAAGGDPSAVTLVAVTKGFPADVALAAARAGLVDLGENYAQELVAKVDTVAADGHGVRWHFLGNLQRNKVRTLAAHVALWQSVDRAALGVEIAKRAPGASVLAQVNLSGEAQKGGCGREELPDLVESLVAAGLDVQGLMGVAPAGPAEPAREGFRWLRASVDRLGLSVCSMGMSGDLEVAVQEGSTMVRVGTGLFGARPPRRA
ncbi:MAG TPA: YggS family pyridoxal phosphate-dependent enzyme [Acidimicrobiales bacterium]|nr:YggS family pyridoxal phosphate-dependent enzyme [Acidimicrobiales bacterium]